MPEIIIRVSARREIKREGVYLERSAGAAVSDRFLAALDSSFEDLARAPRLAPLCGF